MTFATFVLEAVILGYVPLFSTETHAYDHFHISGCTLFYSQLHVYAFADVDLYVKRTRKGKKNMAAA